MVEYHKTLIKVYNFNFYPKTHYDYNFTEVMVEIKSYNDKFIFDIDIPCSAFKREFIENVYKKFNDTDDEYVDLYVYATLLTKSLKDLKFKTGDDGFIIAEFA